MTEGYKWAVICVIGLALGAAGDARAQAPTDTLVVDTALAERGKRLFSGKQCNACHTIGRGKTVGPDLKDLTSRRTLAWIRRMIRAPEAMLLEDSTAQALRKEHGGMPMPNMRVSEEETEALIHYIVSQSRK